MKKKKKKTYLGLVTVLSPSPCHWVIPTFPDLLDEFLYDQLGGRGLGDSDSDEDLLQGIYPISVYHSAIASFYAPSDPSGIRGMRRERIRSTSSWCSTGPWHDCAFVVQKQNGHGFRGVSVVRIKLFFSFMYDSEGGEYSCALVEWFKKDGQSPNAQTGMWVVKPEEDRHRNRLMSVTVIHRSMGYHYSMGPNTFLTSVLKQLS